MMKNLFRLFFFTFLIGLVFVAVQFFSFRVVTPEPIDNTKEKSVGDAEILINDLTQEEGKQRVEFTGTVDDIIRLANNAREENSLPLLQKNEKLVQSALLKATDMKERNYFDHISPEGLQPWFFVEQAGYAYKTVGENLAEGYFSSQSVHGAWMKSDGHRENILSSEFDEIGVAVIAIEKNGIKSFLSVQHFGSQLRQEDLKVVTICDLQSKETCEDAEDKKDEVKKAIKEQEENIKDAKKEGASDKDLRALYENLEKLKDIKRELKDYLEECDNFIKNCDKWK